MDSEEDADAGLGEIGDVEAVEVVEAAEEVVEVGIYVPVRIQGLIGIPLSPSRRAERTWGTSSARTRRWWTGWMGWSKERRQQCRKFYSRGSQI